MGRLTRGIAILALALPAAADELVDRVRRDLVAEPFASTVIPELRAAGDAVYGALAAPALWPEVTPGVHVWSVRGPLGAPLDVAVSVPPGYDSTRAWPLVIALHGTHGNGRDHLQQALAMLGARANALLVAAPDVAAGEKGFSCEQAELVQPLTLLAQLAARVRIDRDRVHLTGYSKGGHATFVETALYGEWLGSSMPLAGTFLITPLWSKHAPLLLANFAQRPTWVVYGADDTEATGPRSTDPNTLRGIAAVNRKLAEMMKAHARKEDLAAVTFHELAGIGHAGVEPSPAVLDAWLAATRPAVGANEAGRTHRFRYPSESWVDGVRATALDGPAWDPRAKIDLKVKAGQSADVALAEYLDRMFGMLSVRWHRADNRLEIRCRRVAELEVWLAEAPLDWSKPVVLTVNGEARTFGVGNRLAADPLQAFLWRRLTGDGSRAMRARLLVPTKAGAKAVLNPDAEPAALFVPPVGGKSEK